MRTFTFLAKLMGKYGQSYGLSPLQIKLLRNQFSHFSQVLSHKTFELKSKLKNRVKALVFVVFDWIRPDRFSIGGWRQAPTTAILKSDGIALEMETYNFPFSRVAVRLNRMCIMAYHLATPLLLPNCERICQTESARRQPHSMVLSNGRSSHGPTICQYATVRSTVTSQLPCHCALN